MVTGTREQASTLAAALRELGAEVLEIPMIRIEPPESYAPLDASLARLVEYDTLLVTSANTARVLVSRKQPPWDAQPFTVAVGPATASALRESGLRVDLQPGPAVAESVVRELAPHARGKRMLLPRATVARDVLPDELRDAGAIVDIVEAYRTVLAGESRTGLEKAFATHVDAVTFTSSSTVENFFALLGEEKAGAALTTAKACSIGPVTSGTLRIFGVAPAVEAREHTVKGLLTAIQALIQDLN